MQTQSDLSNLSADQLSTLAAQLMVEVEHKDSVIKQQDEVIERKERANRHLEAINEKLGHELAILKRHKFIRSSVACWMILLMLISAPSKRN